MLPSQLRVLSAVAAKRRLTTTSLAIVVTVALYANTANAAPTQWPPRKVNDAQEGQDVSEASPKLVWWANFLITVAGVGVATWAVLIVVNWYRARRRRAEDAVRSDEIEKSIRFMTARLYRTRQLWQSDQVQTAQQQQYDSFLEHLMPATVNLCTDQPPHPCEHRRKHISSCNAPYVNDEASQTSNTAVPAPPYLHSQPCPSLVFQQHLSPASRASSRHHSVVGGEHSLAKSESNSLLPSLLSTHEIKNAPPGLLSGRRAGSAPSLPSPFTRVFGGVSRIKALRRALCDLQLRKKRPGSPLLSTPSRRLSYQSSRPAASSRGMESKYIQSITSFQFPARPSETFSVDAGETFLDGSATVLLSPHGCEDGGQDRRGIADGCPAKGIVDVAQCTDVAETDGRVSASFHKDGVDEQDGVQIQQQSHYRPAADGELFLPALTSPPSLRPQCSGDVASRSEIPVAEGSRVDCMARNSSAAVQPPRTEGRAEETVGGTLAKDSVSFLEGSHFDDNARLQEHFVTSSRFKRARGQNGSPTLRTFLSFHHFTPVNSIPRGGTQSSSPLHATITTGASLHQELLCSTHSRRLKKSLQSSLTSLPLSPPSDFSASTAAEETLDNAVVY